MFKAITFSTQNKFDPNRPIDIGSLVECMLFYEKTTVIASRSVLEQLIRYFGIERLLLLIEEELLDIVYTESNLGIITTTKNGKQYHSPLKFSSPQHRYQDELRKICIGVTGKQGKGRRLAQKIQDKIQVTSHSNIILDGANRSILDQNYVSIAAQTTLKELVPELDKISNITFNTERTDSGIEVFTNANFAFINELYHRRVSPKHSSISPALILTHLLDVENDLYFASTNLSELASSNLSSKLAELKIDYVIAQSARSSEILEHFTEFLFQDAKAIREAVNSNHIELDDLIRILQRSKKFKEWLTGITPDTDLIRAYYKEVTKETVADKLPAKSLRWAFFTSVGVAFDSMLTGGLGTVAGIAVGAVDSFYLDKLVKGWKPNQFIEEDVKKLIDAKNYN